LEKQYEKWGRNLILYKWRYVKLINNLNFRKGTLANLLITNEKEAGIWSTAMAKNTPETG